MSSQQPTQHLVGNIALSSILGVWTLVCLIRGCNLDTMLSPWFLRTHGGCRDLQGWQGPRLSDIPLAKPPAITFSAVFSFPPDFCPPLLTPTPNLHPNAAEWSWHASDTKMGRVGMNSSVCVWGGAGTRSAAIVLGKERMRIPSLCFFHIAVGKEHSDPIRGHVSQCSPWPFTEPHVYTIASDFISCPNQTDCCQREERSLKLLFTSTLDAQGTLEQCSLHSKAVAQESSNITLVQC